MPEEEIDPNKLEPVEEDEPGEDDANRPLLVMGMSFIEILALANAIGGASLAFMSVFGRSKQRYDGQSFVESCWKDYGMMFPEETSSSIPAPLLFLSIYVERFFNEALSTMGGSLVFDSLVVLYAGLLLGVQSELGRRYAATTFLTEGLVIAGSLPLLSMIIGPATCLSLAMCWMWRQKRLNPTSPRIQHMPVHDVDAKRALLNVTTSISIIMLLFALLKSGSRGEDHHVHLPEAVLFLLAPIVPSLLQILVPSQPPAYSARVRTIAGVANLACFLLVGAAGFSMHSHGFSKFESVMTKDGGQGVVDAIVRDSLSAAPSRFCFVQFVHLVLATLMFFAVETTGSGGMGLVLFVTSIVGPAGAFGMVGAHREFQLMRDDALI